MPRYRFVPASTITRSGAVLKYGHTSPASQNVMSCLGSRRSCQTFPASSRRSVIPNSPPVQLGSDREVHAPRR